MRFDSEFIVNLKCLENNYSLLKDLAPNNEVIFMVKANGYGNGMVEIVKFAFEQLNIKRFGCASLGEAMEIRKNLPSLEFEVWVFSETMIDNNNYDEVYLDQNFVPVISSIRSLKYISEKSDFKNLPIVLKFNTGMNRLGLKKSELPEILNLLAASGRKSIKHLMTHFANSYMKIKENDRTSRQYKEFLDIKSFFTDNNINIEETSVSNSGAIEQKFGLDETHIRPGLMMYGPRSFGSYKPEATQLWNGQCISELQSRVLDVQSVKRGTPIGYGSHICSEEGEVAFIPIGYGDGILGYYSGVKFITNNCEVKIIGRINMDLMAIFIKKENIGKIKVGDKISLWNNDQKSILDFSTQAQTIPYQVFTSITPRVPKRFIYK